MGQSDVIEVLKKKGVWTTSIELVEILNVNQCNVSRCLRKIYRKGNNSVGLERKVDPKYKGFYWRILCEK